MLTAQVTGGRRMPPGIRMIAASVVRTGIEVLSHGLPELPEQLSYLMAIPVADWTAPHSAVVLFLKFQREGRRHLSRALHVTTRGTMMAGLRTATSSA